MVRGLVGAALFATGLLVFAPAAAAEGPAYAVSLKLTDGERLVGQPRLTVRAGERAVIVIRDAEGHGVSMSLIARPRAGSDSVDVSSTMDIVLSTGERIEAKPALLVTPGQPAAVALGGAPFRMVVTLEAAPGA